MDIGYFAAHEQYDPTTLLEYASRAETVGFDTIWTSDHVHPWWHTDAQCGAAWPWLGSVLESTDDVRIGTGVTPPIARYHPGTIAQVFSTLGSMYPGRVHITLGTGESMNEVPLDYEWPPYSERRKRLIDACEIITRLWDGGFTTYDGHHWSVDTFKLYTLPDERVPMYISANGPNTTRVAGQYANGLLTLVDNERYKETLVPALEDGADRADRDPNEITRIKQLLVSYDEEYERALESIGFWRGIPAVGFDAEIPDPRIIEEEGRELSIEEMTDTWVVTDNPAEIREELETARDVGFDEVEIHSGSPDQETFIDMMESEVFPHF